MEQIYCETKMFSGFDDLITALQMDNQIFDELFNFPELEPQPVAQRIPLWKKIPMVQWPEEAVLDFIKTEISHVFFTPANIERFECISGNILKNLSEYYCQILTNSRQLGSIIYQAKENYIRLNPSREENYQPLINQDNTQQLGTGADSSEEDMPKRLGRRKMNSKRRGKEKSEKLWEFLLHLLRDQRTELIQWENYNEGTFKFVKSTTVARLWGSRNHNDTMNYEKFTRAMRYHYKSKVLLPVPGKRLVYKFGPHAKGWQSSLPIY